MRHIANLVLVFDAVVVVYFAIYALANIILLFVSFATVRFTLLKSQIQTTGYNATFAPLISLLVPAYNEEVTIVDSIRSLLRLDYPNYEIVIVNDGSKDETLRVLKEAYDFRRADLDYNDQLGAARVRGFYRGGARLPKGVVRMVLVDKENGGKADALNAAINASRGTYVASMDADSVMIERALMEGVQPILDDPNRIVAVGGQIALSNGCIVENGRVEKVALPTTWIGRFQVVEYMRSFTQSRTALAELDSLLILSGVFALFQRTSLVAAGGFLSKNMRNRVAQEYCGVGSETVCEDMEVVLRLQRYLMDRRERPRIVFLPVPTCWTEAPEVYEDLGKQRSRWYRGLWEVLRLHRKMIFNSRYGRVGLFALPYQVFFEALAPIMETLGYFLLPLTYALGQLSGKALLSFGAIALAFNFLLSVGSVVVAIVRFRLSACSEGEALFAYRGAKDLFILMIAGLLSNLGYRQYLIWWQLKGLRDFIRGRKNWDKFARAGFAKRAA